MTIRNWRGIGDRGAHVELDHQFTALVGVNNAGKTTVVRFLYEFRPVLHAYLNFFTLARSNSVQSVDEEFWATPAVSPGEQIRPIYMPAVRPRISFDLEGEDENPSMTRVSNVTFIETDRGAWRIEWVLPDRSIVEMQTVRLGRAQDGSPIATIDRGHEPASFIDLPGIENALLSLTKTLYIGPFRNAINAGGSTYYDLEVGSSFVSQFDQSQNGVEPAANEAIAQMTVDLGEIFGFDRLDVTVSPDKTQLNYIIDGKAMRGSELGAGIAQFVIVAATVLIRRPSFLLIDEPELNLHASLQQSFLSLLARHTSTGVIFSTHSLGLARTMADQLLVCHKASNNIVVERYHGASNLSSMVGSLGYGGLQDSAYRAVLLVEGPTEVRTFQQLLAKYDVRQEVVIISLGGDDYASGSKDQEIAELKRLSPIVFAVVDSERTAANADAKSNRVAFAATCKNFDVRCSVLERRSIENYLDQPTARRVLSKPNAVDFGHYSAPDGTWSWNKERNWRIAEEMSLEMIAGTDLDLFLQAVSTIVHQDPTEPSKD
jgi:ABC-type cobalamin/Fe3+-siderophores transport system ATPase subunit